MGCPNARLPRAAQKPPDSPQCKGSEVVGSPIVPRAPFTITLAGVAPQSLSEKAVFLPEAAALLVANVHWGQAETFQRHDIPATVNTHHNAGTVGAPSPMPRQP